MSFFRALIKPSRRSLFFCQQKKPSCESRWRLPYGIGLWHNRWFNSNGNGNNNHSKPVGYLPEMENDNTIKELARNKERERLEMVLGEKYDIKKELEKIELASHFMDNSAPQQGAVLDKYIQIYGSNDVKNDDVIFDDTKWFEMIANLDTSKGKVAIAGINSRELLCDNIRTECKNIIRNNIQEEMWLLDAPQGVGKSTIIQGILNGIGSNSKSLVCASASVKEFGRDLEKIWEKDGGFHFHDYVEGLLESKYPNKSHKLIVFNDIEQAYMYDNLSKYLIGEFGQRMEPSARLKFGCYNVCGSSLLAYNLLSKNAGDVAEDIIKYTYFGQGLKLNSRRLRRRPVITNAVNMKEFKILTNCIADKQLDFDKRGWLSLFFLTGGHPASIDKMVNYYKDENPTNIENILSQSVKEIKDYLNERITSMSDELNKDKSGKMNEIMYKLSSSYWSKWDGFGADKLVLNNDGKDEQKVEEWYKNNKDKFELLFDPINGGGMSLFDVKEIISESQLKLMERRGLIVERDYKIFVAVPYYASIILADPKQNIGYQYGDLAKKHLPMVGSLGIWAFKTYVKYRYATN